MLAMPTALILSLSKLVITKGLILPPMACTLETRMLKSGC